MKRILRKIIKWLLFLLLIPVLGIGVAFIMTVIPVNTGEVDGRTEEIFLHTSGIHLEIALHRKDVSSALMADLRQGAETPILSFGWGDEKFFLETPTWDDLTMGNVVSALCWPTPTLMHFTRYPAPMEGWVAVPISPEELKQLNAYLLHSFSFDDAGHKILLPGKGYSEFDDFYRAEGSYSCMHTCNSWANLALKQAGLKACWWTPFDFGVLWKYEE